MRPSVCYLQSSAIRGRVHISIILKKRHIGNSSGGSWNSTLKSAQNLVVTASGGELGNYTKLVQSDLDLIKKHLTQVLVTTKHPVLKTMSSFYFTGVGAKGKAFRPLIVLLLAKSMFPLRSSWNDNYACSSSSGGGYSQLPPMALSETRKMLIEQLGFIPPGESIGKRESETNPFSSFSTGTNTVTGASPFYIGSNNNNNNEDGVEILEKQKAIAEITEMIHTATLLHDDVIDGADTRRNLPSIPAAFGNKLAILGGDYLLSRASVALARLQNTRVVDLLSQVIADLVEGEIMQLRAPDKQKQFELEYYLQKCFSKTASLMGNGGVTV